MRTRWWLQMGLVACALVVVSSATAKDDGQDEESAMRILRGRAVAEDGTPVADATVTVRALDQALRTTRTDRDGMYEVKMPYHFTKVGVRIQKGGAGFVVGLTTHKRMRRSGPPEPLRRVVMRYAAAFRVRINDSSGPVPGVRVTLAQGRFADKRTDDQGLVELGNLAAGEYLVVAHPSGHAPIIEHVKWDPYATDDAISLTAAKSRSIKIEARNLHTGKPVVGATVTHRTDAGALIPSVRTNSGGLASIRSVPVDAAGHIEVTSDKYGTDQVWIKPGQSELLLLLRRKTAGKSTKPDSTRVTNRAAFRVLRHDGTPASGEWYEVKGAEPEQVDENGELVFLSIPGTTGRLFARTITGVPCRLPVARFDIAASGARPTLVQLPNVCDVLVRCLIDGKPFLRHDTEVDMTGDGEWARVDDDAKKGIIRMRAFNMPNERAQRAYVKMRGQTKRFASLRLGGSDINIPTKRLADVNFVRAYPLRLRCGQSTTASDVQVQRLDEVSGRWRFVGSQIQSISGNANHRRVGDVPAGRYRVVDVRSRIAGPVVRAGPENLKPILIMSSVPLREVRGRVFTPQGLPHYPTTIHVRGEAVKAYNGRPDRERYVRPDGTFEITTARNTDTTIELRHPLCGPTSQWLRPSETGPLRLELTQRPCARIGLSGAPDLRFEWRRSMTAFPSVDYRRAEDMCYVDVRTDESQPWKAASFVLADEQKVVWVSVPSEGAYDVRLDLPGWKPTVMRQIEFAIDPPIHGKTLSRGSAIRVHIDLPKGTTIERMNAVATPISSSRSRRKTRGTADTKDARWYSAIYPLVDGGVRVEGLGEGIVRLDVYVWLHTQARSFKTQFHADVSVDGTSDIEHRFEVK